MAVLTHSWTRCTVTSGYVDLRTIPKMTSIEWCDHYLDQHVSNKEFMGRSGEVTLYVNCFTYRYMGIVDNYGDSKVQCSNKINWSLVASLSP